MCRLLKLLYLCVIFHRRRRRVCFLTFIFKTQLQPDWLEEVIPVLYSVTERFNSNLWITSRLMIRPWCDLRPPWPPEGSLDHLSFTYSGYLKAHRMENGEMWITDWWWVKGGHGSRRWWWLWNEEVKAHWTKWDQWFVEAETCRTMPSASFMWSLKVNSVI